MEKRDWENRCPKCGSDLRQDGALYKKGTLDRISFLADDAPRLALKHPVHAVACSNCGFVELYLDEERA
jgi:predicted nucleic-acid-binding Zn-ribbon protein